MLYRKLLSLSAASLFCLACQTSAGALQPGAIAPSNTTSPTPGVPNPNLPQPNTNLPQPNTNLPQPGSATAPGTNAPQPGTANTPNNYIPPPPAGTNPPNGRQQDNKPPNGTPDNPNVPGWDHP